jgi:hypothetical protein
MTLLRAAAAAAAMILAPACAAAQGTAEQRSACMGDAFQFCGSDIPDVEKITACLKKNVKQISPACQAQFRPQAARGRTPAKPATDISAQKHQPTY